MKSLCRKTKTAIRELQKVYPDKRSALIPALYLAQKEWGYLSLLIQQEVGEMFDLSLQEVRAVVSFYDLFFEEPVGKHIIRVCTNLSCMLRGSDFVLRAFEKEGVLERGKTTREITLLEVECLGACDQAPAALVNEELMGELDEEKVQNIVYQLRV
mgnify:FL=1